MSYKKNFRDFDGKNKKESGIDAAERKMDFRRKDKIGTKIRETARVGNFHRKRE
jgi:hypothetical protein